LNGGCGYYFDLGNISPINHVFSHQSCVTTIVFVAMTNVVVIVDGVLLQQISYWC
jgi:hypothetical protein